MRSLSLIIAIATVLSGGIMLRAAEADALEGAFDTQVRPFLESFCVDCHSGEKPKARFDVSPYKTIDTVIDDFGHWELILDMLAEGEMPPEDEEAQPTAEQREQVVEWIQAIRKREAERNAGDPGIVLARRLSNAEYDYTIRDLTGVDLQPTREFPIDPANEAGFDNSGESLSLSPALLKKYLEAARNISEHLVLLPKGFAFAPHPVATDTDRDKYCVKRIVEFYQHQPTELADYLRATCWLRTSAGAGDFEQRSAQIAERMSISSKYLKTVYDFLSDDTLDKGPVAELRERWIALPQPGAVSDDVLLRECGELADQIEQLREKFAVKIPFLKSRGIHTGSQAFVLWHNRNQAARRRTLNRDALELEGSSATDGNEDTDPQLIVSGDESEQAEQLAALEDFCSVFPDAFYISERGREFLDRAEEVGKGERGRLLSAGFHSMMGYFRDDQPLCELVLSDEENQELDALWAELDFVTSAPMRQHQGLVWFERTDSRFMRGEEFDFARAEDKDVTSEEKIKKLSEVYLAKAVRTGADDLAQEAIIQHFEIINESVRRVERARVQAEPSHLESLMAFAERAYRRPLATGEKIELIDFYEDQRDSDGGSHEEAMRDALVSLLVSPHFWYRVDLPSDEPGIHPLTDLELASRLSYFLWSSMPDDALLAAAVAGDLHEPEVLISQTRRMMEDPKARGLAVEFAGNWLGFRQFEHHNSVDRGRFPQFDDELRQAMFEEPIRFFTEVLRDNRSVLDFLFANDTFVNSDLAEHYGISIPIEESDAWVQIEDAGSAGRGGLLPMAVFQTQNAPGLRTSPVKRGYWVVRQLLGEHIPPPPPNVPELPSDEGIGELTLREQLVRHRADASCAACHERFDSIGLAFEGYGPVGEQRTLDLGGRPVDVSAVFPGGVEGAGLAGLKVYLREHRQDEFAENLCRKLFSYALGRTLLLSDDAVIEEMKAALQNDDYRIHGLIERIVLSPQFLNKRGRVNLANN